jgi:predicted nucleic acid-binding protein
MITVALDTNILAYAEDTNGAEMKNAALALVRRLSPETTLIPVQALAELYSVLVRKAGRSRENARDAVVSWGDSFPMIETSPEVLLAATELAAVHQLGWWDAVMLAAAADAGCRFLLSEDFQDGFTWSGVTVANPFAATPHPLLAALIAT